LYIEKGTPDLSSPENSTSKLQALRSFLSSNSIALAAIALFVLLGVARTNDLSLYTDSTRYLIWGNSVAHAKGFVDDTQPVPEHYIVNAPFYAVFLAPVLLVFPMSLMAAKIWTLLWGAFGLMLLYRWLLRFADSSIALAAVLFLAVNPLMLVISTEVLTEAAFIALVLSSFLLAERIESGEASTKHRIVLVAILSVIMLLREIGISLVAAFAVSYFFRKRYKDFVIVLVAAGVLFGIWTLRNTVLVSIPADNQAPNLKFFFGHFVTPPDASLASELLTRATINLKGYFGESGGSLFYRFPMNLMVSPGSAFAAVSGLISTMNLVIALSILAFVLTGIVIDLRSSRTSTLRLMFLVFYTVIILFYPVHDIRFQLPLLPVVLFYIVRVIEILRAALAGKGKKVPVGMGGTFLLLIAAPNLLCCYEILRTNLSYRLAPTEFWRTSRADDASSNYFATPWSEMGKLVAKHIEGSAAIACSEKEIVPFAPRFKFLEVNRGVPLPMLESMLRTYGISHLIAAESYGNVETFQISLSASSRFRLEMIDSVAGLKLYKVISRLREPAFAPRTQTVTLSTVRASDLMQLGRLSLRSERYSDALSFFTTAREQYDRQSEITFYILVSHALAGDSLEAVQELPRLYASPSATSFIPPARVFLYVMNELKRVRAAPNNPGAPDRLYDAARTVWSLGYGRQAYRLVKELLSRDPNHFVGLLWGWHWGIQLGDSASAGGYLTRLQGIDSANAVVRSFTAMARAHRDLQHAATPADQCRLHLLLASEYTKMELPEEAFDEVERALRADSVSVDAQTMRAELLRKRK
jgi:tetratricopeptide (TPR) repeat protein